MSTFASSFQVTSVFEAEKAIETQGEFILFVGRSTCPFCQRFEPKLAKVAEEHHLKVAFLNSEDQKEADKIQQFRSKYNIPTVPGLLFSKNNQVKVVCDSSLSEEAILAFLS